MGLYACGCAGGSLVRIACPREHAAEFARHGLRYSRFRKETDLLLYWAAVFFVIALVAAVLGFSGIAAGAAGIAKILFFVFVVLFVLSLIFGLSRRNWRAA